jgi:large-conductance mechanosensitive channel
MNRIIENFAENWLDFVFIGTALAIWLIVKAVKHFKKRRNGNDNGESAERHTDV